MAAFFRHLCHCDAFDDFLGYGNSLYRNNSGYSGLGCHAFDPGLSVLERRFLSYPIDILEIGCGLGSGISKIAKCNPCFRIVAIDIDEECISFNRKIFNLPTIQWFHCDWKDIKDRYDIIIAIDVIEHIREYESFLKRLTHHLKVKGTLFLSTPNKLLYRTRVSSDNHYREWDYIAFVHLLKRYFSYIDASRKKGWVFVEVQNPL